MALDLSARLATVQGLLKRNQLAAAARELQPALEAEPSNPAVQILQAVLLLKSGQPPLALPVLVAIRKSDPKNPEVLGLLAATHRMLGDAARAAGMFEKMVEAGHRSVAVYNQLGSCRLEQGDAVGAAEAFKEAIVLDRTSAHSVFNLGMALKQAGGGFETFSTFKRVAELKPDFFDAYIEIWHQMRRLLNWEEGLPLLERGLARHPKSTELRVVVATTYGKLGQVDKAEAMFRRTVANDPAAAPPYAHWLQEEGRFEDSVPVLQESIRVMPVQGQAYYSLANARQFDVDGHPLAAVAESLSGNPGLDEEGRMFLAYTLAKTSENERQYGAAIRYYDEANARAYGLYNQGIVHGEDAVRSDREALQKIYTEDVIEELRSLGSASDVPIFIVGMIRTGTTLLDQIISSHRDVSSAGEQPFWQVSSGRVNLKWHNVGLDSSDLRDLAQRYLAVLDRYADGKVRVVDKMPTNFAYLGLISSVFPKAKFIHMRRSPMDTAISIYTTFLGGGTQFAYNQANIVGYYRAYLETMVFWRTVIPPEQMIEVDYEHLVSQKREVLESLLSFLGLEWDDACMHHEDTVSRVSTPSLWTARQPVTTASVERWRRYEPWLGELLELRDVRHPSPAAALD